MWLDLHRKKGKNSEWDRKMSPGKEGDINSLYTGIYVLLISCLKLHGKLFTIRFKEKECKASEVIIFGHE